MQGERHKAPPREGSTHLELTPKKNCQIKCLWEII